MDYTELWNKIYEVKNELNSLYNSYWNEYSNFETWQFWVIILLLVFPLILLYFTVDRKRIFELFFFGYTIHILWTYIDIALGGNAYLIHKYFLIPIFPNGTCITASVLPVGFLLIYQYCTNNKKNFYLYSLLLSGLFAFGFASVEEYLGFVEFRKGMNQFFLFLIDIGIVYTSYWFTKLILRLKISSH